MMIEGEIVGIRGTSSGRNCQQHPDGCGASLQVGEIFRFKRIVVEVEGTEIISIGAVKVVNGIDTCLIGFLPKYVLGTQGEIVGKLATITRLYANSWRVTEREVDHRNVGVALYQLLDEQL
jgi:hypothetical protein